MNSTRIIIFAKAPLAGYAKTRLIPALGKEEAAKLAKKMLLHTLAEALAADIGIVELCTTPSIQNAAWQGIKLPADVVISEQGEGDLGERMSRATARVIAGEEQVLLIGTDCVEMSGELLRDAAQDLGERDTVIHCTADGGYALLGMKQFSPLLFSAISWSTEVVASSTIARIGQLGWSVHIGKMLHDVDEPKDLQYLKKKDDVYAVA